MTKTEERARAFAIRHHGDQTYGDEPYVVHLEEVNRILVDAGITDDVVLEASWLHDVIEDTPATFESVRDAFGILVTTLVWAVTGIGKNRKERNANAHEKIVALGDDAITLKLADRIANVERSKNDPPRFLMYSKEWIEFRDLRRFGGDARLWNRLFNLMGDR